MNPRACAPRAKIAPDPSGPPAPQRTFAFVPGIRSAANGAMLHEALAPCRVMGGPWRPIEQSGRAAQRRWSWHPLLSGLSRVLMALRPEGRPPLDATRLSHHLLLDLGLTNHVEQPPPRLSRRR